MACPFRADHLQGWGTAGLDWYGRGLGWTLVRLDIDWGVDGQGCAWPWLVMGWARHGLEMFMQNARHGLSFALACLCMGWPWICMSNEGA